LNNVGAFLGGHIMEQASNAFAFKSRSWCKKI
jgi:hypothetical protein